MAVMQTVAPSAELDARECELLASLDIEFDQLEALISSGSDPLADYARKTRSRNGLVVGLSAAEFGRVKETLTSHRYEVDRMKSAAAALELARQVRFDLLLVRLPLPGMEPDTFLGELRGLGSASRSSTLFLMAEPGMLSTAERFVGDGAHKVMRLSRAAPEIGEAVADRPRGKPRLQARCNVVLYYSCGGDVSTQLCQTVNLSESGMLLETGHALPNGIRFRFTLHLPGHSKSLSGVAEVVRHTRNEQEGNEGFAARFVSLEHDARNQLNSYIRRRLDAHSG